MVPRTLTEGRRAPLFTLPGSDGKEHALKGARGGWVLLYFYPKDDTPGCTVEAEVLRDAHAAFVARNVTVYGISTDPLKRHERFSEKLGLPFVLLSDEERVVVEAYGVWGLKKFMGREYMGTSRDSFLIAPDGTIARIYRGVKPAAHAAEVLADLDRLQETS